MDLLLDQAARPPKPPLPSWNRVFHLSLGVLRGTLQANKDSLARGRLLTQHATSPVPFSVKISKQYIPRRREVLPKGMSAKDAEGALKAEWVDFPHRDMRPVEKGVAAERVILFVHGGERGNRATHRGMTWRIAKYAKARVLAIDYRLAPEFVFPVPLNDVLSAYLYLIDPPKDSGAPKYDPSQITFVGDSAGGGLALSAALWLRDSDQYPMPGSLALMSPWIDLTHSMPSWRLNRYYDYLPDQAADPKYINEDRSHYYVSHNDSLSNPLVSPLYAHDDPSRPLPPTLVQCGDAEKLRDEIITFSHNFAGSRVALEMYEDMVHVFQMYSPIERIARLALKRIGQFVLDRGASAQPAVRILNRKTHDVVPVPNPIAIVQVAQRLCIERGIWDPPVQSRVPLPPVCMESMFTLSPGDAGKEVRASLGRLAINVDASHHPAPGEVEEDPEDAE
ncbi:Alpha/Beta hydrolase protein [Blyttiomyces helicus]|uniref:Alpha/Beta hydrolase protein n=1 Tax=Blyttiomyces helicus TaxID=388810 RepID=A0A4P9WQD3_9FUNG|nr:Alpha/Beta hydrolase protein [Blyttiomyces helicus]|eukprot:RKO93076.1 Alpha/Beta hydrolase protein [Blyttiomyces helicus]